MSNGTFFFYLRTSVKKFLQENLHDQARKYTG